LEERLCHAKTHQNAEITVGDGLLNGSKNICTDWENATFAGQQKTLSHITLIQMKRSMRIFGRGKNIGYCMNFISALRSVVHVTKSSMGLSGALRWTKAGKQPDIGAAVAVRFAKPPRQTSIRREKPPG
jgi:hypothetical protein